MTAASPLTVPMHPEQRKLEPGDVFDPRFDRSMSLAQRIHLVMTRLDYVQKSKPQSTDGSKGLKYSIVTHDKVTAETRQHFVACGVICTPSDVDLQIHGNMSIVKMKVEFRNIDDPDDVIVVATCGNGIDPGDKGPGKAMSYAFKYAMLKGLMLETGDDPDTDQDVERLTEDEMKLYESIRQLQQHVQSDPQIVLDALVKDGTVHKDVQAVSQAGSSRAAELRAQVSALARSAGGNLRELWA